jgi:uncharacterized protein with von Willebrand factor type A (vWA) domain
VLLANLLAFGRLLRRLGLDVHPGRMLDVAEALQYVDIRVRDEVYHACRALLVHRYEDLAIFDRAFDAFWNDRRAKVLRHSEPGAETPEPETETPEPETETPVEQNFSSVLLEQRSAPQDLATATEPAEPAPQPEPVWSDAAALASKDFADYTAEEMAVARAALARLVWRPGERRTRRWVRGAGPRLDVRRALRQSLRTGGDVVSLPRRERRRRQRPIVLLCDVSGSMERYSRMLLQFAHAIGRRHRRLEAFLFSTGLTRITRDLRVRGLDAAVSAVARSVPDWSGGTRIGESLRQLHMRWTRRVLRSSSVVLLISDGWDRGDPLLLRDQVARLQRNCHRLIWLNPLIGTVDYAPLTRGLQAALPFVDDFLPARTLTNLADLAVHLNTLAPVARSRH